MEKEKEYSFEGFDDPMKVFPVVWCCVYIFTRICCFAVARFQVSSLLRPTNLGSLKGASRNTLPNSIRPKECYENGELRREASLSETSTLSMQGLLVQYTPKRAQRNFLGEHRETSLASAEKLEIAQRRSDKSLVLPKSSLSECRIFLERVQNIFLERVQNNFLERAQSFFLEQALP
jgi:hypothetical protein